MFFCIKLKLFIKNESFYSFLNFLLIDENIYYFQEEKYGWKEEKKCQFSYVVSGFLI